MTRRNVLMDTIVECTCAWNAIAVNTHAHTENSVVRAWNACMDDVKPKPKAVQVIKNELIVMKNLIQFYSLSPPLKTLI